LLLEVRASEADLFRPRCLLIKTRDHKVQFEAFEGFHVPLFGPPEPLASGP
jgi:hypothetical protein